MASAKKNIPSAAPTAPELTEEGTPVDLGDDESAPIVAPEPEAPREMKLSPADPEIARVKDALDPDPFVPVRKRKGGGGALAFVVDPSGKSGALHHNGKIYNPGDVVMLDTETAKGLGKLVSPKE